MNTKEFSIFPIGYVRVNEEGFCLEIEQEYRPALAGLEGFSYMNVLWWCHGCDDKASRKVLALQRHL